MNVRKMIGTLLRQHGTAMTVQNGRGNTQTEVKAFLQPALTKSWQNTSVEATPLGMVSQGQYVYIGPADVAVSEGDILLVGERAFSFRRVEPYMYNAGIIYIWGLCIEKGMDDSWGR